MKLDYNFEELVNNYLQRYFGQSIDYASKRQIYEALIKATNNVLSENRFQTLQYNREIDNDYKRLYYFSMEFLVGTSLHNNLHNLKLEGVGEFLKKHNIDLEELYELEPDAGLGNGGLGRLASCYMDALTTHNYSVTGFSILYEYGIFKQVIDSNGWQQEFPDEWLNLGSYWLVPRSDQDKEVRFYGEAKEVWDESGFAITHENYTPVIAKPYDLFISGYDTENVNVLRLWSAQSPKGLDMGLFSMGEYTKSSESDAIASSISKVLYPADDTVQGKELRLKQQYFFVSASLQYVLEHHYKKYGHFTNLAEKVNIHINDTHPALCVPELLRLLMDEYKLNWDDAWDIAIETMAYTNHTIMAEALEKWDVTLFRTVLPRIYIIIEEINKRVNQKLYEDGHGDLIESVSIVKHGVIHMANLSIVGSHSVNGVSKLHSQIIKDETFHALYQVSPKKFTNVTNGIAHRRWLCQANPGLTSLVKEICGEGVEKNLELISKLNDYKEDDAVLERLQKIKKDNKKRLAHYIQKTDGTVLDTESIFDIQIKRLHEYKRQLLNALHIIHLYRKIKEENLVITPRTFIFGAKASAGYQMAKETIRLLYGLSEEINRDQKARDMLKVSFIQDYRVSLAEIIIPAANISEQISQAGKEASGTGNMKLMLNGALTIGTLDGANVEIHECVGDENMFLFGLTTKEVNDLRNSGYIPQNYYNSNEDIRQTLDYLRKYGINSQDFSMIVDYLLSEDPYMNLADFASYADAQKRVEECYNNQREFQQKSLINIANSHMFSADRAAQEYVDRIWHLDKLETKSDH